MVEMLKRRMWRSLCKIQNEDKMMKLGIEKECKERRLTDGQSVVTMNGSVAVNS